MPLGEFLEVADSQQAEEAGKQFGYPLMLKSRRLAYDGKGNAVVDSLEKLENAVQQLGGYKHGLYAEKWTPFVKVCIAIFCLGSHLTSHNQNSLLNNTMQSSSLVATSMACMQRNGYPYAVALGYIW